MTRDYIDADVSRMIEDAVYDALDEIEMDEIEMDRVLSSVRANLDSMLQPYEVRDARMLARVVWRRLYQHPDAGQVVGNLIDFAEATGEWSRPVRVVAEQRPTGPGLKVRAAVLARDGGRCRRCGATTYLEIDHIKPRAIGGGNDIENLQVLCRGCNSAKADTFRGKARRRRRRALP